MKKILAVLLALAMLLGFAACGGNNEDTTTTTAEDTTVAEEVTDEAAGAEDTTAADAEETTAADAEETTAADAEETTAADAEETTAAEETTVAGETTAAATTAAPAADMTKAEFVKFYNAETAKIAKNGSYALTRVCEYTDPIDVGGATGALNAIIQAIDENSDLNSVVGGFLGIGTTKGNVPKDDIKGDYKVKAAALTEADLGNFSANNGTYTFTLANASNPKKTNATPISKFTNDFMTHEEVVDGIAGFTTAITVNSTNVNYKNIKVTVKVADGKITDISYSYDFDAVLELKAVIKITGTGAATTKGTYANIKY